jgi:maternal effect protein oskar
LIGDDFLLGLAIFKLKYRAEKKRGVLQAGMCVSGLTIAAAKERLSSLNENIKTAIICIGSIDIAIGRELIQMMQDILDLLVACVNRHIHPVLCTLPPLPNYMLGNRKETLIEFNRYLCDNPLDVSVIDLQKCFIRDSDDTHDSACYINHPRVMSGCKKALILWSNEGRDRVSRMLLKNQGFALLSSSRKVFSFY